MTLAVSTVIYKARTGETGVMSTTGAGPYTVPNMVLGNGYRTLATGYAAYSSCPVVVLIEDTVTYAWELMLATYTAGSPGTLTRFMTLDSSATNGNTPVAVTFGANPVNITIEQPPQGVIDNGFGLPCMPGMYLGNDLGVANITYGNGQTAYSNVSYLTYWPFLWRGTLPIQNVGCYIKTAASTAGGLRVGIMSLSGNSLATATATLIAELTSANLLPTGSVGAYAAALAAPLYLPPGLYIMQATTSSGTSPGLSEFQNFNNNVGLLSGSPGGYFAATERFAWTGAYNSYALTNSIAIPTTATGNSSCPDIQLGM